MMKWLMILLSSLLILTACTWHKFYDQGVINTPIWHQVEGFNYNRMDIGRKCTKKADLKVNYDENRDRGNKVKEDQADYEYGKCMYEHGFRFKVPFGYCSFNEGTKAICDSYGMWK